MRTNLTIFSFKDPLEKIFIIIVDVPDPPVDITLSSPAAGQIQLNWTSAPINDNKPVVYYVAEYRKR